MASLEEAVVSPTYAFGTKAKEQATVAGCGQFYQTFEGTTSADI